MNPQILNELLPKAETGDALKQEELAFAYFYHDEDDASAVQWLEKAEAQGRLSVHGALILALCYEEGCVPKDPSKAAYYYQIAADSDEDTGYANEAYYWLAYGHWAEDAPFGKNDELAVYYLERLLSKKATVLRDEAIADLALLHSTSDSPVYDDDKAEQYIRQAHKSSDHEIVSRAYRAEAVLLVSRICKLAQSLLNQSAEEEKTTRMNRAESGDPMAQYLVYSSSNDDEKYEHFLISSAASGFLPAQAHLARLYQFRIGKHTQAFDLATKVWNNPEFHSEKVYASLRQAMACIIQDDETECFNWCLKLYNNGVRSTFVTYQMGYAYGEGTCVARNPTLAYKHLTECLSIPVNGHDGWIDRARAYIFFNSTGNDALFCVNDSEVTQLAELIYCDAESSFRDEALAFLAEKYGYEPFKSM